jgi:hypothetical protein
MYEKEAPYGFMGSEEIFRGRAEPALKDNPSAE